MHVAAWLQQSDHTHIYMSCSVALHAELSPELVTVWSAKKRRKHIFTPTSPNQKITYNLIDILSRLFLQMVEKVDNVAVSLFCWRVDFRSVHMQLKKEDNTAREPSLFITYKSDVF